MYYVYILKSESYNQVYTGYTSDLKKRISVHNSGHSKHTSKFRPWTLVCYTAFDSKQSAQDFERYLKTGSGIAFTRKHFL